MRALYMAKPCEYCDGPMTEQRFAHPRAPAKRFCSDRCRGFAWRERKLDLEAAEAEAEIERQERLTVSA